MQLLDQIIDNGATGNSEPLANLLRKCLVLASTLKNSSLKIWASNELNGYPSPDVLPPYRVIPIVARGFFLGPFQAQIRDQPLPPIALEPQHRHWATTAYLAQPTAAYDQQSKSGGQIPWPPDLTTLYQAKIIKGYALKSRLAGDTTISFCRP